MFYRKRINLQDISGMKRRETKYFQYLILYIITIMQIVPR